MTADQALAELAGVRTRLLAELERFDDMQFQAAPARGGWSAAHVVEHLARVEGRIQHGARKAVEQGSAVRPAWFDPLLKLPLRASWVDLVRVRTVKGADPLDDAAATTLPRPELMARLAAVRAVTVTFLERTRERDLSRIYMSHPFFGAFGVREFLAWVAWHEERHRKQLVRIRGSWVPR